MTDLWIAPDKSKGYDPINWIWLPLRTNLSALKLEPPFLRYKIGNMFMEAVWQWLQSIHNVFHKTKSLGRWIWLVFLDISTSFMGRPSINNDGFWRFLTLVSDSVQFQWPSSIGRPISRALSSWLMKQTSLHAKRNLAFPVHKLLMCKAYYQCNLTVLFQYIHFPSTEGLRFGSSRK